MRFSFNRYLGPTELVRAITAFEDETLLSVAGTIVPRTTPWSLVTPQELMSLHRKRVIAAARCHFQAWPRRLGLRLYVSLAECQAVLFADAANPKKLSAAEIRDIEGLVEAYVTLKMPFEGIAAALDKARYALGWFSANDMIALEKYDQSHREPT